MKLSKIISKLCKPAQVYMTLSIVSIILYLVAMFNMNDVIMEADDEIKIEELRYYTLCGLVVNVILTIIWIGLLNYICQFKYGKKIAWFIVLLPFFFMALFLIGLVCALSFITLQTQKTNLLREKINNNE
jgi:hypothetical protein|tara:strand:+ start:494 stop:883 length:390 start_codon:yes stop_codon:yes gene_type:complete